MPRKRRAQGFFRVVSLSIEDFMTTPRRMNQFHHFCFGNGTASIVSVGRFH